MEPSPTKPPSGRRQKVLDQPIEPSDDPICCCEAEPRWLQFEHGPDDQPTEWESLSRPPSQEL